MSDSRVPLTFVDGVKIGMLDGTGESVQFNLTSTVAMSDGSTEEAVAGRFAMTKLAFMGLATTCEQGASDINGSAPVEAAANRQKN